MAGVNTKNKRRSAYAIPPYVVFPYPDGDVDNRTDRTHMASVYSGSAPAVTKTKTLELDARLVKFFNFTPTVDSNAILQKARTKTLGLSAALSKVRTKTVSIDAVLREYDALDSYLGNLGNRKRAVFCPLLSHVTPPIPDGVLTTQHDRRHTAGIYPFSFIDTLVKTISIDAVLFVIKARTRALNLTAALKKSRTKALALDAKFEKVNTNTLGLNAILKKAKTKTLVIDARLLFLYTKTTTLDAILRGTGRLRTTELNAILTGAAPKVLSLSAVLYRPGTKTTNLDARLTKVNFGNRSLTVFPIGYLDNSKSTSKGSFTDPAIALEDKRDNWLFEPNKGSNKVVRGHTLRLKDRATPMETREVSKERHDFTYNYENIWSSEYRIIKRFVKDISDHNTYSFHLVDFSGAVKVTGLATTGVATYNASLHNTEDFTTASGRGGNYICVRNGVTRRLRIGKVASVVADSSVSFQATPEGYGNLATAIENETYAYPLYKVFITGQGLNFRTTGHGNTTEVASFAGPLKSGTIRFSQEDVE